MAPGNLDDMITYSKSYRERNIPYIFDPGQSIPALSTDALIEALTGSRLFISNDYELEMVMRSTGMQKSDLLKKTGAIITTLGERGSLISTSEGDVQIPAVPVERVLDPTGAGDAFRAGLIKGLVMGKSLAGSGPNGRGVCRLRSGMPGDAMPSLFSGRILGRYEANFGRMS